MKDDRENKESICDFWYNNRPPDWAFCSIQKTDWLIDSRRKKVMVENKDNEYNVDVRVLFMYVCFNV